MNGQQHASRFKSKHRMSLAQSEHTRFTKHEGNGGSLAAKTLQEALRLPPESWWKRTFKWEKNLTVAGRVIEKGWVIPQQLGIALILLIISGVVGMYWVMDARIDAKDEAYQQQRDMLIEIKTELKIQKEHELEYRNEFKTKLNVQQLQIEQLQVKASLKPDGARKDN